jgi:hypothetical protein
MLLDENHTLRVKLLGIRHPITKVIIGARRGRKAEARRGGPIVGVLQ